MARSTALVVLPEPTRLVAVVARVARSMVMLFGISASVKAAQVRLPLAAMVVANWLEAQSLGLAARAVAVVALPLRAPLQGRGSHSAI